MCLAGAVVACWFVTQEVAGSNTHFLQKYFSSSTDSVDSFRKNSIASSWIRVIKRMKSITAVKKKVLLYKAKFYADTLCAQYPRVSSLCDVIHWISPTLANWQFCIETVVMMLFLPTLVATIFIHCVFTELKLDKSIILRSYNLRARGLTLIRVLQSHYLPSHLLLIPPNWTAALSLNAPLSHNYQSYPYMAAHFSQVAMGFSVLKNTVTHRTLLWTQL